MFCCLEGADPNLLNNFSTRTATFTAIANLQNFYYPLITQTLTALNNVNHWIAQASADAGISIFLAFLPYSANHDFPFGI